MRITGWTGLLVSVALTVSAAGSLTGCSSGKDAPKAEETSAPTESATPSQSPRQSPSSAGSQAADDLCSYLTPQDVERLLGPDSGQGTARQSNGLPTCQWSTDGSRFAQVIGLDAQDWAQAVPDIIKSIEKSGIAVDAENARKLKAGAKLVESGNALDPNEACELFSAMAEIQGRPPNSWWVVNIVPNPDSPQAVTGQACRNGRFTSVTVADVAGLDGELPIQDVTDLLRAAVGRSAG